MKRGIALALAVLFIAVHGNDGAVAGEDDRRFTLDRIEPRRPDIPANPSLDARLAALALMPDRRLPDRVDGIPGFDRIGDLVPVEVFPVEGSENLVAELLQNAGATDVSVLPSAVLAIVPVGALARIAESPGVRWVGASPTPIADGTGQGVAKIGAPAWFSNGFTGAGIKVAIIDLGFEGYESLLGTELPAKVHTFDGCPGDMVDPSDSASARRHGTGVAEIVHEVAPHATLYLMCVNNSVDLQLAVDHAIEQGVTVINHSVGWFNSGRGDGTGTIGNITMKARDGGILWVNSAGNTARARTGGIFNDTDADGYHEFIPEVDETISFELTAGSGFTAFLRWDEWPIAATDLDLDLYLHPPSEDTLLAISGNPQTGTQPPADRLDYVNTSGSTQHLHLAIFRVAGSGTPDMDLFLLGPPQPIDNNVSARSITDPATAPWVVAAGAFCHQTEAIRPFSSRGPTIGNDVKPDLTGPDGVSSSTYSGFTGCDNFSGFAGTSAASPHVAGAAALLQGSSGICSPSLLRNALIANTEPVGDPVPNNDYGHGRMLLDAPPAPTDPVLRYAGANRYATAADISANDFPCGAHTVLVATGENFPDALAGAAVAARYAAPILLVQPNAIPAATLAELTRLDPERIIILGGTAAVSSTVASQLGAYGTVSRIAGSNRWGTARLISTAAFPDASQVTDVFIANGFGFADALAGGPSAAYRDAPLLLVDHDWIPPDTLTELGRLGPQRVWVLGGPAAIANSVVTQLQGLGYTVQRLDGANRYETAVRASQNASRTGSNETAGVLSHRVYIAVGTNFPDALAGAGAAGIRHAPILLVQPTSIPQSVIAEIERLNPREIVILGGTGVVSAAVENQLRALLD